MPNPESFPQQDIERIREKTEELKKSPEFERAEPREIVKESIKQAYPGIVVPEPVEGHPTTDHDEDKLLPEYMKGDSKEDKDEVEALLHIAFTQGIEASVKEARRHRARILDDFHDALVDKVMPQLEKQ